jgi:hypothetical protein
MKPKGRLLEGTHRFGVSVKCFFTEKDNDQLSKLATGQQLTVRGRCAGMSANLSLQKCIIASR